MRKAEPSNLADPYAKWHRITATDDEMVNTKLEAAEMNIEKACNGGSCSAPATGKLQIRVGYDDGFLSQVGGTSAKAKAYIDSAFAHVQASYCHPSLGTKIIVERVGSPKHYSGRSLQATEPKLEEMFTTTQNDLQGADLMFYIGYETEQFGTVGLAYVGTVCLPYSDELKQSINEWRKTTAQAGYVFAHEMGHNLGMLHDFSDEHKGKGCNGEGIMSYGKPPSRWSHCSVADFQAHYQNYKNSWCMEGTNKKRIQGVLFYMRWILSVRNF